MEGAELTTNADTNVASDFVQVKKKRGGRPSVYDRKLQQLASESALVPADPANLPGVPPSSNGSRLKTKTLTSFHCGVCGKELSTKEGLLNHGSIHTGEKPFACQVAECGKVFRTKSDRSKHHKTHEGVKPHTCEECLATFTTKTNLKTHQKVAHTGKKEYKCATCKKTFGYLTNYRNHLLVHTGEKPYICSYGGCGQRFTEYSTALRHALRKHASDGTFQCSSCDKCYRNQSSLEHHKKAAHGDLATPEDSASPSRTLLSPDALSDVVREEFSYFTDLIQTNNPFVLPMSVDEERETAVLMGLYDGECEDELKELRKQIERAEEDQSSVSVSRGTTPSWDLASTCDDSAVDLFPELTATTNEAGFVPLDGHHVGKNKPKRRRKN
ncbi:hypothetical protein RvY_13080 [Ramazzottius varieornatus]|uniref:C2H2-type domain-containing protein n=1 Tax=Ramazzottius varieornatus TaxID=947166 RepID=A0A1D1VLP0_RAMVA|nr:hypothetical protein RvY_13080 [Ramazzottius varieornatus]